MKTVDLKNIDSLPGKSLDENSVFSFKCHSGLSCFNLCCRNLNLFLNPYDALRLKSRLGMSSGDFIDRHVDVILRNSNFFPDVLLKMDENDEKTCPFLKESGCGVYEDRPDTCRFFPMERGALYEDGKKKPRIIRFFNPPDFCEGRRETTQWTPDGWAADQDGVLYEEMTLLWAEVKALFDQNPWKTGSANGPRGKMAFMAAYNIDAFKEFVLDSSFLKRFKVKGSVLKKIKKDDAALLKFGFEWIRFFVWGIQTRNIVPKRK
jgi:uncharacterized protein